MYILERMVGGVTYFSFVRRGVYFGEGGMNVYFVSRQESKFSRHRKLMNYRVKKE